MIEFLGLCTQNLIKSFKYLLSGQLRFSEVISKAASISYDSLSISLIIAFISAGVITHNFNRSQLATQQDKQEALINGLILTETKKSEKYWEIYGETGTYNSSNEVAVLDNVIGNFYDENNQVSMSFESSHGTYNSKKNEIILYENTTIVIKDGTTLKTKRLTWSGSNNPVTARGDVVITRNNEFYATAEEVEISPDYSSFKIMGHAVSKLYDNKEKK